MTGHLKTSMEISWERSTRFFPGGGTPLQGLDDLGLEAFLHLLDPDLPLPAAHIKPRLLTVQLRQKGERREVSLSIRNTGRGHLSGSIEVADTIPGLRLSSGRFGVDSRDRQGTQIQIGIDGSLLEPGRRYNTKLILSTNGKPERIEVPLSVQLVDGKSRVEEMTGTLIKYGAVPMLAYYLLLVHKISMHYGFHSPFKAISDSTVLARYLCIYLFLLTSLSLPFLQLFCGRRPNKFVWSLWAIAVIYTVYRLEIAVSSGIPEVAAAFVSIYALAILVPAVIIALIRQTYYHLPHLHGSRALIIIVVITILLWSGLYSNPPWLLSRNLGPTVAPQPQTVSTKIVLSAQDNSQALYHLSGAEEKEIVITFSEKCWVKVWQDGEVITEKTYSPGEEVRLFDATETQMRLGFPTGAHIVVNGLELDDNIPGAPYNIVIVKE